MESSTKGNEEGIKTPPIHFFLLNSICDKYWSWTWWLLGKKATDFFCLDDQNDFWWRTRWNPIKCFFDVLLLWIKTLLLLRPTMIFTVVIFGSNFLPLFQSCVLSLSPSLSLTLSHSISPSLSLSLSLPFSLPVFPHFLFFSPSLSLSLNVHIF